MGKLMIFALILTLSIATIGGPGANASHLANVQLGDALGFAVLADSAISNTGPTTINGDVGLSPETGAAITGLNASQVTGTIYTVDAAGPAGSVENPGHLTNATNGQDAAYVDADTRPGATVVVAGELGGLVLTHGVYKDDGAPASLAITGTLTLDAGGDPTAVWIFQSASTLTTASGSQVVLQNGAQACNVFWQLDSSATLGTNSVFKGTILANVTITAGTGAAIEGRLLAGQGAVNLDNNAITRSTCAVARTRRPTPRPTATPTASPVPSATPTATPAPSATPIATPVATATPAPAATPVVAPTAPPVGSIAVPVPVAAPVIKVITKLPSTSTAGGSGSEPAGRLY